MANLRATQNGYAHGRIIEAGEEFGWDEKVLPKWAVVIDDDTPAPVKRGRPAKAQEPTSNGVAEELGVAPDWIAHAPVDQNDDI